MTKYITNTELKLLNDKAIRLNFNRAISDDFVKEVKNLKYPITQCFLHNDEHYRLGIFFPNKTSINEQDITAYLDIEIKDYDKLAEV
tara:strand:- start:75 stop:335 length:261 start_codon:yes stop_codon:yes gene_type:complete